MIVLVSLLLAYPAAAEPQKVPPGGFRGGSADELRLEQVFPQMAGKNQVRWYEFNWKQTDFRPVTDGAPVRLYFYESERKVAELAQPLITEAYLNLAGAFGYTPAYTIPFLLYNSHFEFESTHAFYVSEQVLGVTSTEDLKMAIPYWGEHQRFIEVMRHELAHQFTIQKVWSNSQNADCNPLEYMPLWFIEGLAQYYALRGLTPDVRAVLVERIVYPRKDAKLPRFFTDTEMTFERVYLIGHAQVTFLDDTFGNGTLQKVLSRAPELCNRRSFFGGADVAGEPFEQLLASITGSNAKVVQDLWEQWAAAVVAPARTAQTPRAAMHEVKDLGDGQPDSFVISPDGKTLFYRTLDFDTGVARLYLRDVEDAGSRRRLAADQSLGMVSLHPLDRRVTALGRDRLAYIGRVGSTDVLFVRKFRRVVDGGDVRFELGDVIKHPLNRYDDLIEGGHPAINPKTGAVAFVGLNRRTGFLDVFEVVEPFSDDSPLRRLSHDEYAEQGLVYDGEGNLFLTSDATYDGHYQVMRLEEGRKTQVTFVGGDADAAAPSPATNGVIYQSGASGFHQAYMQRGDSTVRLTDAPTFVLTPALDAAGNLYGITLREGERRLVRINRAQVLALPGTMAAPAPPRVAGEGPWKLPSGKFAKVKDYSSTDLRNYNMVGAQAAAALGSVAAGTIVFADLFNTNMIGVSAFYAGQADLGEFVVAYLNRSRRLGLGGSAFLTNGLQLEHPDDDNGDIDTFLLQRFGASFDTEYPLSRYVRLTASVAPQQLRAYRFSNPGGAFAQKYRMSTFAVEARTGFAFDTTRLSLFGPVRGQSWVVSAEGTMTGGKVDPFGDVTTDYQIFYPFISNYERWIANLRVAGGTSAGGAFHEQFYVPAAYNLRTLSEGSLELFGEHYYLGQLETQFPLSPVWGNALYFQGVVGADLGAVSFRVNEAWSERRAAWITGTNVGLGPVIVRFHFGRPFDVGGEPPVKNIWHSYLSIMLSPLAFAQ